MSAVASGDLGALSLRRREGGEALGGIFCQPKPDAVPLPPGPEHCDEMTASPHYVEAGPRGGSRHAAGFWQQQTDPGQSQKLKSTFEGCFPVKLNGCWSQTETHSFSQLCTHP